jgi:hypothetical protein
MQWFFPTTEGWAINNTFVVSKTFRRLLNLESPLFIRSDRLDRSLRFTVETTLPGEAGSVKEYLIGTEVYERKPSSHPGEDSTAWQLGTSLHAQ